MIFEIWWTCRGNIERDMSRLLLCEAAANTMKEGFNILGLSTVERMWRPDGSPLGLLFNKDVYEMSKERRMNGEISPWIDRRDHVNYLKIGILFRKKHASIDVFLIYWKLVFIFRQ